MGVQGNYKIAKVRFLSGYNTTKVYHFALFDNDITVGDYVVCDTTNGFNIGTVINIVNKEECSGCVTKEVVCKVDFSAFYHRKENRERMSEIKKRLDSVVKDKIDLVIYQTIAESSPEIAELLEEYKKLLAEQ